MTVYGSVFLIFLFDAEFAAPSCYLAVDFDGIDASFCILMRNIRLVSGVNHIARAVAPVDDDLPLASLDGEEQRFAIFDLPVGYEQCFIGGCLIALFICCEVRVVI